MGLRLSTRFDNHVSVYKTSGATSETSSTTAKAIDGSTVSLLPKEACDGMVIEWMAAGTKTNANAAHTVTLVGNGATLLTLTADAATASDWVAKITLRFTNPASQKLIGELILDTEDPEINYAAATTDFSGGGQIIMYVTAGNASDVLDSEMCIVKKYIG